jgi:hypothetical protein
LAKSDFSLTDVALLKDVGFVLVKEKEKPE